MPEKPPRSFARRFFRFLRWSGLVLLILLGLLFIPAVFQFAVRQGIRFETWRRGGNVEIGQVEGSLFQPVVLHDSRWDYRSAAGGSTHLEITRAEAVFAWRKLVEAGKARWLRRLSLEGVRGKISVPVTPREPRHAAASRSHRFPLAWFPKPARVEAERVDLTFESDDDYVRLQDTRWMISEVEPGFIEISQLGLKQPWLRRTFRNVRGTTFEQEGSAVVANLQLEPGVAIKTFAARLAEVAQGRLDMDLDVDAYGGNIRMQAQTSGRPGLPEFEANGRFSQIAIAPLATFLGVSDAAGGTIKEGNFTFRGSPRELARSEASLRLEATNFQWESRQWDSLVLGMTMLERRLQVPELVLRQGHNNLSLHGELALPAAATWQALLQTDFNFKLAAKIENLTELSALVLPEFQYTAGKAEVDGSVSAKDQQFSGYLIVSGRDLGWRNTPVQELHGAIRLAGKEVQIASLDLLNQDDYLHGQGVVSLGDSGEYRGEFRVSVEDFGKYAALGTLLPEPLAGGASLRWTGLGKGGVHSGRFFARLQKLRPLRKDNSLAHPVDAELEGTYEPGQLRLAKFQVADEECRLSAKLGVFDQHVEVRELRLLHGNQTCLEGELSMPHVWWRGVPPSSSPGQVPRALQVDLKATGLSLKHAVRLSGWDWPVEGFVDGTLQGGGPLGQLALKGRAKLQSGRLPLSWSGDSLANVQAELVADGQKIRASGVQAEHETGKYAGELELDLARYWDLELKGSAATNRASFAAFPRLTLPTVVPGTDQTVPTGLQTEAKLTLRVSGPLSSALVEGEVEPRQVTLRGAPALGFFWERSGVLTTLPLPFSVPAAPFAKWRLQLHAKTPEPARILPGEGTFTTDLQIGGTAEKPDLQGAIVAQGVPVRVGPLEMSLKEMKLTYAPDAVHEPVLDLHATGLFQSYPFNAYVLGPLPLRVAFMDSDEALSQLDPKASSLQKTSSPVLFLPTLPGTSGSVTLPWSAPTAKPASPSPLPAKPTPPAPAPAPAVAPKQGS